MSRRPDNYLADLEAFGEAEPVDRQRATAPSLTDIMTAVWGGGWHSLCSATSSTDFRVDGRHDDPDELLDQAAELTAAGRNVWFDFHPMPTRPRTRADAKLVEKVVAIPCDLDWADSAHKAKPDDLPTEAELRERLARFPYQPSVVICSGHGLQPWWLLDAPVDADRGKELIARLHTALDDAGLPPDRADLASLLRVPGSFNWKSAPAEVTVESADLGRRYTPEWLEKRLPKVKTKRALETQVSNGDAPDNEEWRTGPIGAGQRHASLVRAAGWCRQMGLTRNEAIPIMRDVLNRHAPAQYDEAYALAQLDDVYGRYEPGNRLAERRDGPPTNVDPTTGEIALPIPKYFSDAEVGEAFGEVIRGRWLHCRALGGWLGWDGRRWERDVTEGVFEEARQYILKVGQQLFASSADNDKIKAAARYRDRGKLDAIVTIARRLDGIAATADDFDQHPDLLAVGNGVVDLRTGELRAHDPDLRITQCTNVDYRPDARHADVDAVLDVVEDNVRSWLQRLFGYAATGHVTEDVMPVFDGSGSNGKTTLLAAVRAALGDYGHVADARLLMKGAHEEHPTLFADLRGRRLVSVEETAEGGSLRVEAMKFLTGGSPIAARFIRGDYFTFDPTHMLVIATNHRPAVNSTEHATWRRLRLVPFPHRYAEDEHRRDGDRVVDPRLRERLRGRAQREAMLTWIVAGAIDWNSDGLGNSDQVRQLTDAWRRSEDVILRFAHDRLEFDPGSDVGSQALYDEYRAWCESEGRAVAALKQFASRFEEHDIAAEHHVERRKTMHGVRWFGCRLRGSI